jgi:uncharacterized protein (DUF2235 family)
MPKNIVICCDGTDNQITTDSTNVFRVATMCERSADQIVFYDTGSGTVADPDKNTWLLKKLNSKLDSATAMRISVNVLAAYRFLVHHYQPNDRIYFFGFSRGAYTARAVAGLIQLFGLLEPDFENLTSMAWAVYSNDSQSSTTMQQFIAGNRVKKHHFSRAIPIHFLGCWDTVAAYLRPIQLCPFGLFIHKTLMYTAQNPSVNIIRHAIALDERRSFFKANYFRPNAKKPVDIKQVFFPGVHSDVGGGYPEEEGDLSKISLLWMLREAIAFGLKIDPARAAQFFDPAKQSQYVTAVQHESLQGFFHLIELMPSVTYHPIITIPGNPKTPRAVDDDGKRWKGPNLWRRRQIPESPAMAIKIHQSVFDRQAAIPKYQPKNLPANLPVEPWSSFDSP